MTNHIGNVMFGAAGDLKTLFLPQLDEKKWKYFNQSRSGRRLCTTTTNTLQESIKSLSFAPGESIWTRKLFTHNSKPLYRMAYSVLTPDFFKLEKYFEVNMSDMQIRVTLFFRFRESSSRGNEPIGLQKLGYKIS